MTLLFIFFFFLQACPSSQPNSVDKSFLPEVTQSDSGASPSFSWLDKLLQLKGNVVMNVGFIVEDCNCRGEVISTR